MRKCIFAACCILAVAGVVSEAASRVGDRSVWESWHAQATHKLEHALFANTDRGRMLSESIKLHHRARELLHETDMPEGTLLKFHGGLDMHAAMVDKATALAGHTQDELTRLIKKAEASLSRLYHKGLRSGFVPPPRPKVGELRAAMFKATGIDTTADDDGKLFNIMVDHYGGNPPAAALGVSAKFFSNGQKMTGRYHIGLRLPCAAVAADATSDAAAHLSASSHQAASALSAPPVVHKWIDTIGTARVGLGFGFAKLDDQGNKGGKIYVMNLAGTTMPKLPLSTGSTVTVHDSISLLKPLLDVSGRQYWLDSQMVSLEWKKGDDRVILRHYAAERGLTHGQRIRASGSQSEQGLSNLVATAGAKTETIAYTAPFRAEDVSAPPALVGSKVGMQMPDSTMSDVSFLSVAYSAFSGIHVAKREVEQWLHDSQGVPHTVSNVQAAATTSGSYITLYRHPLNVCFERFSPSDDEMHARSVLRRGFAMTECQQAEARLADSVWADGGAENQIGTCANSHKPTGACQQCMDEWDSTGYYMIKEKTGCTANELSSEDVSSASSVSLCAQACRDKATVGGLQCEYFLHGTGVCKLVWADLPAVPRKTDPLDFPGFNTCAAVGYGGDMKCLVRNDEGEMEQDENCCAKAGSGSCQPGFVYCKGVPGCLSEAWGSHTTCCVANTTKVGTSNATFTAQDCPAQPSSPANWKYKSQAKVPDLCTAVDAATTLYRQAGTQDKEGKEMGKVGLPDHFPDYCSKVCKDEWLTPCSDICQEHINDFYDKCKGCKGGKDYCVDSDANSEDNKKEFDWAGKLPMAPSDCKDSPESLACKTYVIDYIEGGSTVSGVAVYDDKVTDSDMMDVMSSWAPRQCRPPFYNWFDKDKFLCKECFSVIQEAEKNNNLWGGTGFCDYGNECTCPEGDACDAVEMDKCINSRTPCQCTCRDMLQRGRDVCGASTSNATGFTSKVNPTICNPSLSSNCAIGKCRSAAGNEVKWQDKEPELSLGLWGGDHQCLVGDGTSLSPTCSSSMATMDDEGKADYLKRMISGCRLGAERSCVDEKYQYNKAVTDLSSSATTRSPLYVPLLVSMAASFLVMWSAI